MGLAPALLRNGLTGQVDDRLACGQRPLHGGELPGGRLGGIGLKALKLGGLHGCQGSTGAADQRELVARREQLWHQSPTNKTTAPHQQNPHAPRALELGQRLGTLWISERELAWRLPDLVAMAEAPASKPAAAAIKKGALVKVNRAAYGGSLESKASDTTAPDYLFEGPAEVLLVKGDYAQLRYRRPVPDIWLRLDQLEAFN